MRHCVVWASRAWSAWHVPRVLLQLVGQHPPPLRQLGDAEKVTEDAEQNVLARPAKLTLPAAAIPEKAHGLKLRSLQVVVPGCVGRSGAHALHLGVDPHLPLAHKTVGERVLRHFPFVAAPAPPQEPLVVRTTPAQTPLAHADAVPLVARLGHHVPRAQRDQRGRGLGGRHAPHRESSAGNIFCSRNTSLPWTSCPPPATPQ